VVGEHFAHHASTSILRVVPQTHTRRRVQHKAKGPVDATLGRRLRALREGRGLTQLQLAAKDFTPGFISLLENGHTRVSLRAAEILAHRLGVGVPDLLGTPRGTQATLALLRAEQELAAGHFDQAGQIAESLIRRTVGAERVRAQRVRGRALIGLGRPAEAVKILDAIGREQRGAVDPLLRVRVLFDLALAHQALDAPGEALRFALQCDAAFQNGEIVDRSLELQILLFLANGFARIGDTGSANVRAQRALEVAADVGDRATLAALYGGLAVTREDRGDVEAAVTYAHRSIQLYDEIGDQRAVAEAWNTAAWVNIRRKDFQAAERALTRGEALASAAAQASLLAVLKATRAELLLARGHPSEAAALAAGAANDPAATEYGRASALLVRAQALAADKRVPTAKVKTAFAAAMDAGATQPSSFRVSVQESLADALEARGATADALAAARRAREVRRAQT
jgi:transcriptional regulator with XRE-family HTH domain